MLFSVIEQDTKSLILPDYFSVDSFFDFENALPQPPKSIYMYIGAQGKGKLKNPFHSLNTSSNFLALEVLAYILNYFR
jgi:hypothetical protein